MRQSIAFLIKPTAVYDEQEVRTRLGLRTSTLMTERRLGRLRYARVGNRVCFLGEWLLAWIAGREVTARERVESL